ncbi:MAG: FHA domain-containing protein [Myxococcota bacterium]
MFLNHYTDLLIALHKVQNPGVVVLSADLQGLVSIATVAASSTVRSVIVGRHDRADVHLARPDTALRHLQILVWTDEDQRLRYRVLDLRTDLGLRNEGGERLHGIEASGTAFVEVGAYTLMVVPRQGPLQWPQDPVAAWRALPARRLRPIVGATTTDAAPSVDSPTVVHELPALSDGDESSHHPIGTIYLRSERGTRRLVMDPMALRSGVLLGRHTRCDGGGMDGPCGPRISRVHAIVFEAGGVLYLADCGSSNGVWRDGKQETQPVPFSPGEELYLGPPQESSSVRVRWVR